MASKEVKDYLVSVLIMIALVVLLTIVLAFLLNSSLYDDFDDFKNNTEVIEGKVTDVKEGSSFVFINRYYLVVRTKEGSSKLIEVKENQFKNNQKGSHVKFRYYTDEDLENKIAIDLSKYKDVHNNKEFKSYYKQDKIIVWRY
ncbi:hypothetical protein [Mammaliicoccus sciuri]|uniref:Uncharacterized protein n=1 Tax=Mammaliicoccus sciuri TaxID=1296 RepID=A0AAW5LJ46_MAMSC|nr:hypothetical protein [Mammaliicoccus sciuri]MBG9206953.1 hypothetical protein [Mammaliicoccus sciuri]MCQ9304911.1 hypothetical protein [Mammaliicoccus sciuri]